ncbi:flavin-containing monooxygenase [Rhodococcus sp. NPDC057529]|uniref:flavin-containing monooxygenase n=1 Tax=Rhodococcus sp. NPDC057529 TaxID=3346158 RepID=UPI00366CCC30
MFDSAFAERLVGGPLDFEPESLQRRYDMERERRVRPEGSAQYVGATDAFANYSNDPWLESPLQRDPLVEHTDVIIVGGGFGGLVTAARLHEAGFRDIRFIESAGDFGGTWYWNRYPGAMCDIEAHIYMPLLEEMGYAPKHRYAYADELFEHSQAIGRRYGLYEKACFQTRVESTRWRADIEGWEVTTDRGDRLTCNYLIIAAGRQSLPKLPRIHGIGDFRGHIFHSSRWDSTYTGGANDGQLTGLADKRVAVIGTGATAIQIVPAVAQWAGELLVFQRTPSTVGPRDNCPTPPDWVTAPEPGWQRRRRENFQSFILGRIPPVDEIQDGWTDFNKRILPPRDELERELGRPLTEAEADTAARVMDFKLMNHLRDRIDETVKDPATAESLKPWYRWLCKRPGWHDDYLPAFNRPNVRLIDTHGLGVQAFTERGLVTGGDEYEVDAVIFATGFEADISYTKLLGFDPIGSAGVSLSRHWEEKGTRTWFGMMTDEFPNLFFVGANQQTAAAFNATHLIDEHAGHLAHILRAVRDQGGHLVEPTSEAIDEYVDFLANSQTNQNLVKFFAECTPGYFNNEGRATRNEDLFAGGRCADPLFYYRMLESWRTDGKLTGLNVAARHEPATAP